MDPERSRYCTGTDIYIDNYTDMLFDLYNYKEIYRKEKKKKSVLIHSRFTDIFTLYGFSDIASWRISKGLE